MTSITAEPADETSTVHRACPLCEACCGLAVTVRGNTIVDIRGDADDPFSRGYLCPKGLANADLVADPDRLRKPLVRRSPGEETAEPNDQEHPGFDAAQWRQASWDEALTAAADGLADVVRRHGPDAVAVYIGNAAVHGVGGPLLGSELLTLLGSRRRYTASSLDQQPQQLVNQLLFGSPVAFAVPDLDRTEHMLILGGNPAVSNGSIMTAPDMRRRLKEIRQRGGRVVVVDPRRTETAKLADEHVFIRPGTDVFLLLGMLHTITGDAPVDLGPSADCIDRAGADALVAAVRPFPPSAVADITGIPAETIARLAREFAAAPAAAAYGRLGVCQTEWGTTAFWLITCLNTLTGNLDRPGGLMFPTPAIDLAALLGRWTAMPGYDRYRSRVGGIPEVAGDLPSATLAAEMRQDGPQRIRALVTIGGNPVLSVPDGRGTDAALEGLEFMVAVDPFLTESSRHADVLLPPQVAFERDEVEAVFGSLSVRNWARWSPRAVEPAPDTRDDGHILAGLIERLALRVGRPDRRIRALSVARVVKHGQLDRMIDLGIRTGPHGRYGLGGLSLDKIKAAPHGLDLGPLRSRLSERLFTADKRLHLDHPVLMADLTRAAAHLASHGQSTLDRDAGFDLLLIGRRHLRSNNSWLANSARLVRGRDRCTVLIHPDDAVVRGLGDGDQALVTGRAGVIQVPVEVCDEIMPGVVAIPHGWGHGRQGVGWRTAAAHPGASVNDIIPAQTMDPLSGNAVLQGVPVRVSPIPDLDGSGTDDVELPNASGTGTAGLPADAESGAR